MNNYPMDQFGNCIECGGGIEGSIDHMPDCIFEEKERPMEQCETSICTRPAEVEKERGAVFSMSSTSTQSKRTIKLCVPCAEQEERMKQLSRPERKSAV